MSTRHAATTRGHQASRKRDIRRAVPARVWWRSRWLLIGVVVGVAAVVVAMLAVELGAGGGSTATADATAPADVVDPVTHPDAAALNAAAAGVTANPFVALPSTATATGPTGHPQVLYVGADYCPFCAARRWSLIVALSRFGSFSNLGLTTSSSTDVFPDTNTFSFHGSTYTSPWIDFEAVERATHDGAPLEAPTAAQQHTLATYDVPPYSSQPDAIPFLDVGDRFLSVGGGFSPQLIQGMTWQQVAAVVRNPDDPRGRAIMGDADVITAAICAITGGQPGDVCGSPAVTRFAPTFAARG